MPILFGVTLFASATLLFLVQPMVGKMVLPLLGGTPAVWNTCMVFFQALLLAGYYYAHKTSTSLPTRRQVAVHSGLLLATVGALAVGVAVSDRNSPVPIFKSLAPQGSDVPFFGVILILAAAIGLPFFTVSTTAPLLQKWFSETGHPSARDPYFLYAASNFGSLLALVGYPFVVEPNTTLNGQAWLWAVGFVVLIALIFACGKAVAQAPPPRPPANGRPTGKPADEPEPSFGTRLRWLILAAVPSSLMLALTTQITTDIVSTPLLWIVPLSLYLITFIIVFSQWVPKWLHLLITLVAPVLALLIAFVRAPQNFTTGINPPVWVFIVLEFVAFFVLTLMCHGELARTRPSAKYLTNFYLTMSMGGMIGGLFNALVAPLVFVYITEYPVTIIAACLVMPRLSVVADPTGKHAPLRFNRFDLIVPVAFFFAAGLLAYFFWDIVNGLQWLVQQLSIGLPGASVTKVALVLTFGLTCLAAYLYVERPWRFGSVLAAIWLASYVNYRIAEAKTPEDQRPVYSRSFFGTLKVEPGESYTRLVHGTTLHGKQNRHPAILSVVTGLSPMMAVQPLDMIALTPIAEPHWRRADSFPDREPLTYYHRTGPVGKAFEEFESKPRTNTAVACIGLGTGSLSSYGHKGQTMTFFEIDTAVRRLVEEPNHFTYIEAAKKDGVNIEFLMGDARLTLEDARDRKWGIMFVDAFSSDAIPAHLLTVQSLELYFSRLEEDGICMLHISNRYLNLEPVVERICKSLKYEAVVLEDDATTEQEILEGKTSSSWIAVAKTSTALGGLTRKGRPIKEKDGVGLWTDDFTPLLSILKGDLKIFGQ